MKKIDLDALEAAIAKCPERPWRWNRSDMGQIQVSGARHARQVCAVWNSTQYPATELADVITASVNALPALIAELRELRAQTTPEPIGDKHRDGKEWLVWDPEKKGWTLAWWDSFFPAWSGSDGFMFPEGWSSTHALSLPDAPEVAE